MIRRLLMGLAVCLVTGQASAATDANGKMIPTGVRCASLGEVCRFDGTMMVHLAGCKSIDRYNGGCASSPGVVATGSLNCTLASFGLKAPLPDVGENACYLETLSEAGVDPKTEARRKKTIPASITGANCVSTGVMTVDTTIIVNKSVYDGLCKTFVPGMGLKRSGTETTDKPVFRLENGATLKNVIVGEGPGDDEGVYILNGATLDNVRWTKIRDKAVTVKAAGNVLIKNISAANAKGRVFQVDAPATLEVSNCVIDNAHSFVNQSAGSAFNISIFADKCLLSNIKDAVFVSDSPGSIAKLTNSHLRKADVLCKGPWVSCPDVGNFYD